MLVTSEQLLKAAKRISKDREKVVKNISYARQISGEDDAQYREHLARLDSSYKLILDKIDEYKVSN